MESLLSWFSESQTVTAADESPPAPHLPPPDFLSLVRRSRRSLRQTTPTGEEPLTAVEQRLRELVVDLYSDQHTPLPESEELSEIDSGNFSDRPLTSELHVCSPSPVAMATVPRETTPLGSYGNTTTTPTDPPPLLATFSADDIAEVDQEPIISPLPNFELRPSLIGPHPPSPYEMGPPSPPHSLLLYSHTEPTLTPHTSPPHTSTTSDFRSLVNRSFQLTTPTSVLATPPREHATPTKQQATPTNSLTDSESLKDGETTVYADSAKQEAVQDAVLSGDLSHTPSSSSQLDSASEEKRDSDRESREREVDLTPGKHTPPSLPYSLPYHPGGVRGVQLEQSPLSPKEIRDRLADMAQWKTPLLTHTSTTSLPTGLHTETGRGRGREGPLKEREVLELQNFEDVETSSVVSIEQITDALRHDLPPFPDRERTPSYDRGNLAFPLPLSSSPLPPKATPSHSKYTKPTKTLMNMPEHLRPTHTQQVSDLSRPHRPSKGATISLPTHTTPSSEQQLVEALHAKAHLQGQLETLTEECHELLDERAELSSKLAVAEAQLEVSRREIGDSGTVRERTEGSAGVREQLQESQRELRQERKAVERVREDLSRVRTSEQRLKTQLVTERERGLVLAGRVREVSERLREMEREVEQEKVSGEETQQQLRSLQSSCQAMEESKQWMQSQLQESLEDRQKLKEELRTAKSDVIAHSIKVDQLTRENSGFLDQIADLQQGVLQDKARLVSELEVIEADVLSREDSYGRLISEKTQLEELAQQRLREIERLSSELGQIHTERDELRAGREESTNEQYRVLQRSKKEFEDRVREVERELAGREQELERLQRGRAGLQERLREREAALVGKEGALTGLRESQEILQRELEMARDTQGQVERELEEEKRRVVLLEATLAASRDDGGRDDLVRSLQLIQQELEGENSALRERVRGGEVEIREKERELTTALTRAQESATKLEDLRKDLDSVTIQSESIKRTLSEREVSVGGLMREVESAGEELERVKSDRDILQSRLNTTLQQRSRLEGQLSEQTSLQELEHLQRALQESSELRRELERVKTGYQRELMEVQAGQSQTERELRAVNREKERVQRQLQKALQSAEETAVKMSELKSVKTSELSELSEEVEKERRGKGDLEREVCTLRIRLEEAMEKSQWLGKEAEEVRNRLEHESVEKGEVERASSMVALRLKQTAEERERELRDRNQSLSLELEQLRGRLAGVAITQQAMKTHTTHLESTLGDRDSSLTKLSSELEREKRERQSREEEIQNEVASLRDEVASLQAELGEARDKLSQERESSLQLAGELEEASQELGQLKRERLTEGKSLGVLEERASRVGRERDELRLELMTVKAELVVAKTATEAAEREVGDRKTQLEMVQQKLLSSEEESREREREVESLRAQLEEKVFDSTISSIRGEGEETDSAPPPTHGEITSSSGIPLLMYEHTHTHRVQCVISSQRAPARGPAEGARAEDCASKERGTGSSRGSQ